MVEDLNLLKLEVVDLLELQYAVKEMTEANDYLEANDSCVAEYVARYPGAYYTQSRLETEVDKKVEEADDIVKALDSITEDIVTTNAAVALNSSTVLIVLVISQIAFYLAFD